MADIRATGTWQRVERGLTDMNNLMSRGEYNLSLVKGRQTMEQIVRLYAGQSFVVYTDLADTIENLYSGGHINKETRDGFHTVRILGNRAVHEGDNSSQDAMQSYRILEQEIQTFAQRGQRLRATGGGAQSTGSSEAQSSKPVSAQERERVMIDTRKRDTSQRRVYDRLDDRAERDRKQVPTREDRLRERKRQSTTGKRKRSGSRTQKAAQSGINIVDILRILIPVVCLILVVILVRSCMRGNQPIETTAQTETMTEPVTEPVTTAPPETEPETTEPAPTRYRIKGNAVNIRYADNENRVYTQLADGTEIGEASEVEGTDKLQFTLDGVAVTVNKNYVTPIEDGAAETATE